MASKVIAESNKHFLFPTALDIKYFTYLLATMADNEDDLVDYDEEEVRASEAQK